MATILVVDDMPIFREPIAASLRLAGFETVCASEGLEALAAARSRRPDLVLLDVAMPGVDGIAFLKALRADPELAGLPVILLTAKSERHYITDAARLGVKDYLLKSQFSLEVLLERVRKHLPAGAAPQKATTPPRPRPEPHNPAPTAVQRRGPAAGAATTPAPAPQSYAPQSHVPQSHMPQSHVPPAKPITRDDCLARAKAALRGKTLSGVVSQVMATAGSPRSSVADLASLIGQDPVLSARVLQTANSAAYRSGRPLITAIPDAVRHIGSATVRQLASAVGIFDAMPSCGPDGFNPIRCWQHSFAVATLCERMTSGRDDAELAYLVGLCHDLGEILCRTNFAAEYREVLDREAQTGAPRREVERAVLGATHDELVSTVLACLELPPAVRVPIEQFHEAAAAGKAPEGSPLARVLWLAELYATGLLLSSSPRDRVRPVTRAETRAAGAPGDREPACPDAMMLRAEVLATTAPLARLSPAEELELTRPWYDRRPVRLWLARDPGLSPFDPLAAALASMADVEVRERMPSSPEELTGFHGLAVVARTAGAAGFTTHEVRRATGAGDDPRPVIWLVGRAGMTPATPAGGIEPQQWPVGLDQLAAFVAAAAARSDEGLVLQR